MGIAERQGWARMGLLERYDAINSQKLKTET